MLDAWSEAIERLHSPTVPPIDWPPEHVRRVVHWSPAPRKVKVPCATARRPRLDVTPERVLAAIRGGIVTAPALAARFNVSAETVRRRIAQLKRAGLV